MPGEMLPKIETGIPGFDELSYGGLPKGKVTLVSGTTGAGKTIFAAGFVYNGVTKYNETSVFVTFEERPEDIIRNMKSIGMDLSTLIEKKKLSFVDGSKQVGEQTEIGSYSMDGLISRTVYAIKKVKAKRLAMDSISALLERFESKVAIRNGLYDLVVQLKQLGVTSVITSERREERGQHPSVGPAEFVSDNVILLHNFMEHEKRKRTIEILKFRGADYDTAEGRLIIDKTGLEVFPSPKVFLSTGSSKKKLKTGIAGLDEMLYGGLYAKSTTLVTGASGTGKTITGMQFILEGAKRGEKGLLLAFEESQEQLARNAASFGWPMDEYFKNGMITIICGLAEGSPIEKQYKSVQRAVWEIKPRRFVLDSLSSLERIYEPDKFREFTVGLNNFLKNEGVASIMINTTAALFSVESATETHLSTATDNIIILKYVELGGRMRRLINVLKQRGSMHKKELMEYVITPADGLKILGPFTGIENLMSGAPRRIQVKFGEEEAERDFIAEAAAGKI